MSYSEVVETARIYYNSDDADNFYANIWGGEDIHIGLYQTHTDSIFDASHRTLVKMGELLSLDSTKQVLDIGAGYGGTARYFATTFGCAVDCLNLSEIQNQRNRSINQDQKLDSLIGVIDGSFEDIPANSDAYDVVISQDAILHSGNRTKVLQEVHRVLRPGGEFLFTDPMQADDCPSGVLKPVLERIHLDSLGSIGFYTEALVKLGFEPIQTLKMTEHLVNHYTHVRQQIEANEADLNKICSADYIERMKAGLGHWIEAGKNQYLAWGFLHFRKC